MQAGLSSRVSTFINKPNIKKTIGKLCDPSALAPVIALETTVITGRTYNAYKRGKETEARERFTEETLTSAIWLFGVLTLNKTFDATLKNLHKVPLLNKIKGIDSLKHITVDVGSDHGRNPLKHLIQSNAQKGIHINEKLLSAVKLGKIAASTLIAVYLAGSVIPRTIQKITDNKFKKKNQQVDSTSPALSLRQDSRTNLKTKPVKQPMTMDNFISTTKKSDRKASKNNSSISFGFNSGNSFSLLNSIANNLENHPLVRVLSVDAGVTGGRIEHARNKDEGIEIGFRDASSLYFYMFATPHLVGLMSKTFPFVNISPEMTDITHDKITDVLKTHQGKSNDELKALMIGEYDKELVQQVEQELAAKKQKTIPLDEIESVFGKLVSGNKLAQIQQKAADIAEKINFANGNQRFITVEQISDVVNDSEVYDPEFMRKIFNTATGSDFDNPEKFISQKKLKSIKTGVIQYVERMFEQAEKQGIESINEDFLVKMKNENVFKKLGFTGIGLVLSALFLSTIIPQIQYAITRIRTGSNKFPGIAKYEQKQ